MLHLGQVTIDTFHSFHVSDSWCYTEARHRHHRSCDIEAPDRDSPLHGADKRLVDLDTLDVKKLRKDMQAPEIKQHIELSMELAAGLGINGTPSFLVGNQLAPGLVPYEELVRMVENARGEKTK